MYSPAPSMNMKSDDLDKSEFQEEITEAGKLFFFIGASKCATTSVSTGLALHPRLYHKSGEDHIFEQRKSETKMLAELANILPDKRNRNAKVVMEYTPEYLFESRNAARICATLKMLKSSCETHKYLLFLRNPTERTLSSWEFKVLRHAEVLSLKQVVIKGTRLIGKLVQCWENVVPQQELPWTLASVTMPIADNQLDHSEQLQRRAAAQPSSVFPSTMPKSWRRASRKCPTEIVLSPEPHTTHEFLARSHIGKGLYFFQLVAWFTTIPRTQFHIILMETFYKDPVHHFSDILRWLELQPIDEEKGIEGFSSRSELENAATLHENSHHSTALQKQITQEMKLLLDRTFRPYNLLLDALLGYETGYAR